MGFIDSYENFAGIIRRVFIFTILSKYNEYNFKNSSFIGRKNCENIHLWNTPQMRRTNFVHLFQTHSVYKYIDQLSVKHFFFVVFYNTFYFYFIL